MEKTKKYIIIGIVCLISPLLQSTSSIAMLIPYLSFCLCSLAIGVKNKRGLGIVAILLFGLIALPIFDFIYSTLTAPFMTTLFANVFTSLMQTCIYFGLFILVNSWIIKEKFSFSLVTGILTISCIAVYSVLEGLQAFALINAMKQAIEHGNLFDWLYVMDSGNLFVSILSGIMFYIALWCISIRFVKEN